MKKKLRRTRVEILYILIRYDWLQFRRGFQSSFRRPRDWLLLIAAVPIALAAAASFAVRLIEALPTVPGIVPLLVMASSGFFTSPMIGRRIRNLGENSVVAKHALKVSTIASYLLLYNSLIIVIGYTLITVSYYYHPTHALLLNILFGWLAYGLGAASSRLIPLLVGSIKRMRNSSQSRGPFRPLAAEPLLRGDRLRRLIVTRQTFMSLRLVKSMTCCSLSGVGMGVIYGFLMHTDPRLGLLALGPVFVTVCILSRLDAKIVRYFGIDGIGPIEPVWIQLLAPTAFLIGFAFASTALLASGGLAIVASSLGSIVLITVIIMLRSFHYRVRSKAAADFLAQIDFVVVAIVGYYAPPLGLLVLAIRLKQLQVRARDARWIIP